MSGLWDELVEAGRFVACLALDCALVHEIDDSADAKNARMRFRCTRCGTATPWETWHGRTRAALEQGISDLAKKGIRP